MFSKSKRYFFRKNYFFLHILYFEDVISLQIGHKIVFPVGATDHDVNHELAFHQIAFACVAADHDVNHELACHQIAFVSCSAADYGKIL